MEEKIKIYITNSINSILLKDMENFNFYKKDGSFNKNEFYNTLILNYYQQYQQIQSDLFSHIKTILDELDNLNTNTKSDLASNIINYTNIKNNMLDQQKSDVVLTMKPTKNTADVFDYIQDCCLFNTSLSAYFRNMFASYSLLPQDKRERIIFKSNFDIIEKAINENKKIYFNIIGKNKSYVVSPYAIANSKEELFNYLLADNETKPYSFRIGRIKKITIINEINQINEDNIAVFEKMIQQGPQYSYDNHQINQTIKVLLTDKGKEKYKRIYLHRPTYIKIENNYYYFNCSFEQAYQYFMRFGKDAIIEEPIELKEKMKNYYYDSFISYQ